MSYTQSAPILVYDGDCGFCTRSVRFVLDHDRKASVCFAAREGVAGRGIRQRHAGLEMVESLLWVEKVNGVEHVRTHSDAVLAVAEHLGGIWALLAKLGRLVPRAIRDPAYNAVARVRRKIIRGAPNCLLPTPQELARMLP